MMRTTFPVPARLAVAAALLGAALPASAQLLPDRLYYGVNRPVPMRVDLPDGAAGDATIDLYAPASTTPEASAPVVEGGVDLASLFPTLWTSPAPRLRYAQLAVGGRKVGPPVILQPLTNPSAALLYSAERKSAFFIDPQTRQPSFDPREGKIAFVPEPPTHAGLRAYADQHVVLETDQGAIEFRLRPDEAPNTCFNFLELVRGGFYTDVVFHRVVPRLPSGHPFVIQTGDPTGTGSGGPGYSIDLEPSALPHDFGVLSMARDSEPNTNGSQIFICLSREGTQPLDGRYAAFGQAVTGADVILRIAAVPLRGERPDDPPVILNARTIDAPPFGEAPRPVQRPADPPKGR